MLTGENMPLERQDKERLLRIVDFLSTELTDLKNKFLETGFKDYQTNSDLRRNLERCIENIVNSSLDTAKIILITEKLAVPDTYRDYFFSLCAKDLIPAKIGDTLAEGVRLRNILAHQYLDIRWKRIEDFLKNDWMAYEEYINCLKKYLENR